ncbi:hypothetical protein TRAPUB_6706 [Trametes pubescens]|uniref:Uncharacterized protein n=1 Tax=Trametes pubescens TaxID=154538 RepID=A0A1M2V536_TRAPU|nr:hypothetical protein TRAPUB_6706 [Trametes pubescens]
MSTLSHDENPIACGMPTDRLLWWGVSLLCGTCPTRSTSGDGRVLWDPASPLDIPIVEWKKSSLANGLQGPQRASTGPSPLAGTHHPLLSGQALASGKTLGAALEDYASLPEHVEEDDFEEISYDELRLSLCPADPAHFAPVFDYQRAYNHTLLSRSRSSISRLRKLSRASLKRPRDALTRTRAKHVRTLVEDPAREQTPSFELSKPSSSSSSTSSRASTSPETPPAHTSPLLFLGPDPARKPASPNDKEASPTAHFEDEAAVESDSLALAPAATPPSPKAKSFSSSLRRLRTLSRSSLFSARRHAPQVCDALPAESSGASLHHHSPPTAAEALQLPELVFDDLDFSFIVEENTSTPPATTFIATQLDSAAETETPVTPPLPRIEVHEPSPRLRTASLQLPRCLFVDPQSLTASAPASAVDRISRFWSAPPSPAWLSRNVEGVEPAAHSSPLPLPIPPPPSPPLYIVPRSLRPDSYYLREPEVAPKDSPYAIFIPAPNAHEYSEAVNFRPPAYLLNFVKKILRTSTIDPDMDLTSKQAETVDWGGEVDYSGIEWFKDPPPRPEQPPPPQATMDNYVPQPGVIEQNEAFDYALKSAPNVLYARFKQFGQLGVLAWCSEFSELIDALKHLGFDGNMFVSTRTQALKTCEDILKLNLDIEMQIIVMYLSSQVARLRRFLDADHQWDDYPKPKFPIDPNEYGKQ